MNTRKELLENEHEREPNEEGDRDRRCREIGVSRRVVGCVYNGTYASGVFVLTVDNAKRNERNALWNDDSQPRAQEQSGSKSSQPRHRGPYDTLARLHIPVQPTFTDSKTRRTKAASQSQTTIQPRGRP